MVQGGDNEIPNKVSKEGDKVGRRGNRHRKEGEFNKIKFENNMKDDDSCQPTFS